VLFIGEAPGKNEDIEGRPFVGRSGKLLTSILEEIGLTRTKDYYITNIVKCRPPENRDPTPEEIALCSDYLIRQIEMMQPKIIVTLGRFSFSFLVPGKTISEARGGVYQIHGIQGKPLSFATKVLSVYHPAVALYNPSKKSIIEEDLLKIKKLLQLP